MANDRQSAAFWQELGAADAVAKLIRMIETKATVIRDGQDRDVPLDAIVPGDVVRLRAGDLIPGDCRVIAARDLFVNEATLTGESFPAEKLTAVVSENATLRERSNVLFLGTHVVSGIGTAVVVGTGLDTEFGRISERLQLKAPETGFERGLRHFGQLLVKVVLVITAVVFAIKVGWQGNPIVESTLTGLMILLVIRTQGTFFESRPGTLFLVAELGVAITAILLPYSPLASTLGFVAPPIGLMVIVLVITALYGLGMETVKRLFYRHLAE